MTITTVPLYKQVFPRFGDLDVTLPHGFEDQSNDQDDCPSFALFADGEGGEAVLTIFIDYKVEADRAYAMEQGASPCRFHVHANGTGESLTTNEWDEVLQWVEDRRPKPLHFAGFEANGWHIVNPTCCDPRGMACDPAIYGFKPVSTGGGCMGLRKELPDGSYVLLTDAVGVSIDLGPLGADFLLGLYGRNGEELGTWVMQVGEAYNPPGDATDGDGTPRNQLFDESASKPAPKPKASGSRYSIDLEGDDGVTVTLKGITAGKSMSAEEHALALMKHAADWRIVGIDREPAKDAS